MNIRFYFQEIDKGSQEKLRNYLTDKKLSRLTRLLQHGNLALAKFVLNAKYHRHHDIFLVRLGLKVAKKDLNSEEGSQNLLEAFDLALDKLINQLRRLESLKQNA
ncbi:MAG: HPF/RaiA family ribosome-associated protein [Patescibacteria group bacterium]